MEPDGQDLVPGTVTEAQPQRLRSLLGEYFNQGLDSRLSWASCEKTLDKTSAI